MILKKGERLGSEEGGFDAVRMRDVAAHAGVALGTFYKRFRSKEDLLVAALELEVERLGKRIRQRPLRGESPQDRACRLLAELSWESNRQKHC